MVDGDRVNGLAYVDDQVFDAEMERIFRDGWVFVGHISEVPAPGDVVCRNLGGDPYLLIRGRDDEVRVLANRCSHLSLIHI